MSRTSAFYLAFFLVALSLSAAVGFSAEVSLAASDLPSNQQVLALLTETIDWYRYRTIERQIATEPGDLVFMEDNRPIAAHIVQLSFDCARALAAISSAANQGSTAMASGASAELARFAQQENSAELASRQAIQEIEEIKKKLVAPGSADRHKLQAALDATQGRLDLLQAGLATLHEVVEFVRASGFRQTEDLQSSIDDLAKTVPDVTSPMAGRPEMSNYDAASIGKPRDSGILGLSSEVSALGSKLRILDEEIGRTDKLRRSTNDLRSLLLAYIQKRFPAVVDNYLQDDLLILQQQKARLDALRVVIKELAPATVALDKQSVLFGAYTSHLNSWRAAVGSENEKAWKGLILRLVGVALVIGALIVIGAAGRRFTDRHVHDAEHRHVFRVTERVVLWFTIVLVVAFSFASDLTSLATFFGLLTAGLAVALQSVILAALGYFLLVGSRGIKVGDRVQISGVTGDVTDIGWFQFRLGELDNETHQPTGRVVTFSNSFVFVSPATGLSKFNREDFKPALGSGTKAPRS
jgi:Mechanosensitive ion channel